MIRILIVDDEKPICDLIDMNLSAAGYDCRSVQDGIAAIDLIEKEDFDLSSWTLCCREQTDLILWNI